MLKVAIVILNFKLKDQTIKCINSVKKSSYKNLDIIIVDNNSGDGIGEDLKKISGINFIQNTENLGYTGGNNIGIKMALKNRADWVFILNPDTTIEQNTITNLLNSSQQDRIGIICPKIYFSESKKIWYAGGIFDMQNVLGRHRGIDEVDIGQYDNVTETDYATGAAMFIKKEVFDKIGLFDSRYFLYYEDADFSMRTKHAGFKILYNPAAIIFHKNAQTTGLGSPLQDYYITRNRLLFASKFLPLRTRFALLREAWHHRQIPARRKALIDVFLGKFGKGEI